MYCEFRVHGHLGAGWRDWLSGMTITNLAGCEALIAGEVVDQAALVGLLQRLQTFNIRLLAVHCGAEQPRQAQAGQP